MMIWQSDPTPTSAHPSPVPGLTLSGSEKEPGIPRILGPGWVWLATWTTGSLQTLYAVPEVHAASRALIGTVKGGHGVLSLAALSWGPDSRSLCWAHLASRAVHLLHCATPRQRHQLPADAIADVQSWQPSGCWDGTYLGRIPCYSSGSEPMAQGRLLQGGCLLLSSVSGSLHCRAPGRGSRVPRDSTGMSLGKIKCRSVCRPHLPPCLRWWT